MEAGEFIDIDLAGRSAGTVDHLQHTAYKKTDYRAIDVLLLRIGSQADDLWGRGVVDIHAKIICGKEVVEFRGNQREERDTGAVELTLQLVHDVVLQGIGEGLDERSEVRIGPQNGKKPGIVCRHEFDKMRQGAIFSVLIQTQEPDIGGKEVDGGFHEEFAL